MRLPLLLDPTGSRGIYTWGVIELFLTIDFSFSIVATLIIAFYWDAEVHSVTDSFAFTLLKWKFKVPGFLACGILLVLEIVSSVMRALFMPAKPFLIAKALSYAVVSFSVAIYLLFVGLKLTRILKGASDFASGKKLGRSFKMKMYATLGISACLIMFPIAAILAASPLYVTPIGYFGCRFFAGFFLYTATILQITLFNPPKGWSSASKGSSATSHNSRKPKDDADVELSIESSET